MCRDVQPSQRSSESVAIAPHARPARAGQWFVFVGDSGYWDSGFVLMGWN